MAGEGIDVRHEQRTARGGGGPADAFAKRDTHAGGLALERAHDQLAFLHEVKAGPVEPRQGIENEGGRVRGIGDQIALAGEQPFAVRRQLRVIRGLIAKLIARTEVAHASGSLDGESQDFVDMLRPGREHHHPVEAERHASAIGQARLESGQQVLVAFERGQTPAQRARDSPV